MSLLDALYRPSLTLLTDLYQLTMAEAAWKAGVATRRTVFHLLFRKSPFKGGFTVAAGLEQVLELLERFRIDPHEVEALGGLTAPGGAPLFDPAFLRTLASLRPDVEIDAVPEGSVVFPQEPLLRVVGPVLTCMLLETPLLTLVNFQSLVATKAARICMAADGDPVIEFGLRRAQGPDGAISASRAAYIGGCSATSNVLAARLLGIPVRGTHAHSWVMLYGDELRAFQAYAEALPHNCVFLVDTYRTVEGVRNAIEVGRELRARGETLQGVRLDSGDLAYLSIEARRLLDAAGFTDAHILATNDLDEHVIQSLKEQGARIDVWGVGTRLVTAFDEPALGGVFKLSAVQADGGWEPRLKLSEQAAKTSIPGVLQTRRFRSKEGMVGDMIYDLSLGTPGTTLVDPVDPTRERQMEPGLPHEDLLVPVFRNGKRTRPEESLDTIRGRLRTQLAELHPGVKRFLNPHEYPVGLELGLHARRMELVRLARRRSQGAT